MQKEEGSDSVYIYNKNKSILSVENLNVNRKMWVSIFYAVTQVLQLASTPVTCKSSKQKNCPQEVKFNVVA